MEYTIIDKKSIPEVNRDCTAKWKAIFEPLKENQALRFRCKDKIASANLSSSIKGSLARFGIKIKCRRIPNGVGSDLYVWKV